MEKGHIQRFSVEKFNAESDTVDFFAQARTSGGGRASIDVYVTWNDEKQEFEVTTNQRVVC